MASVAIVGVDEVAPRFWLGLVVGLDFELFLVSVLRVDRVDGAFCLVAAALDEVFVDVLALFALTVFFFSSTVGH